MPHLNGKGTDVQRVKEPMNTNNKVCGAGKVTVTTNNAVCVLVKDPMTSNNDDQQQCGV